ncbi:MAG: PAS domain S-box protein [Bacteroidia bacterium]
MESQLTYEQLLEENKKLKAQLNVDYTHSSHQLLSIFEEMGIAVIGANPTTAEFSYVNKEMLRLTGYSKAEILKMGVADLHPINVLERVRQLFGQLANGEISKAIEVPILRKDGKLVYCDITSALVEINQQPLLIGFFSDISDLVENNQALFRTKEMYHQLVESSSEGILICESGQIIFANQVASQIFGATNAELVHQSILSFIHSEGKLMIEELQKKRNEGSVEVYKFETYGNRKDATSFPLEIISGRYNYQGKDTELVLLKDISEKSYFSNKIKESEETAKAILKAFPDVLSRISRTGLIIDLHTNEDLGFFASPNEFIGRNIVEVFPESLSKLITHQIELSIQNQHTRNLEFSLESDGVTNYYEARFAPIQEIDQVIAVIRNVTQETLLTNEVKEKENLFKLIADHSNDVIWIYNLSNNEFTYNSPSVTQLRGYTPEEVLGQKMEDVFTPETLKKVHEILPLRINAFVQQADAVYNHVDEFQEYHKDGRILFTEVSTSFFYNADQTLSVLGITRDISERKLIEQKDAIQKHVLELILKGDSLQETFDVILKAIEFELPQAKIAIMNYLPETNSLSYVSGNKISDYYIKLLESLQIGKGVGTCGDAIFTKELIITEDLLKDKNWIPFKEVAIAENLGSCFSYPILSSDGSVLGTFAVYHSYPFKPTNANLKFIESFVSLASIAIQRNTFETSLKESEDKFSKAFNAGPDSFSITTLEDGVFIDVNDVFQEEFLYTKKEVIGKSSVEINIWANKKDRIKFKKELEKTGRIKDFETILVNKNGEQLYYEISSQVVSISDGKKWVLSNSRNITQSKIEQLERERLIQKEKESSGRIIDILETISDGFFSLDPSFVITYMNFKAGEITNHRPQNSIGKVFWTVFKLHQDNKLRRACEEAVNAKNLLQITDFVEEFNRWLEFKIYPAHEGLNIFFRDITEQKNAEIQLQESELKFRTLFEATPDGIIYYDDQGKEELLNSSALQILDLKPEHFLTRNPNDVPFLIYDQDGREMQKEESATFKVLKSGKPLINQVYGLKSKATQQFLWLRSNVIPFRDNQNKLKVFVSFADITQQKLAEQALAKSQAELKRAAIIAQLGNFKLDMKELVLIGSDKAYELFGFENSRPVPLAEVLNKIHRNDLPVWRKYWQDSMKNSQYRFEFRIHIEDKIRWLSLWGESQYSPETKSGEILGMVMDITERKRAELQAENEKERLQTLIETIPDLVWLKDVQGKYMLCNPQFSRLYKKEPQEMIGLTDYDLLEDSLAHEFESFDQLALNSDVPVKSIGSMKRSPKEGDLIVETFKTKLFDTEGNLVGILGVGRDLTEITGATKALLESERKLKEAQHFAKMGNWELEIRTGKFTWSDEIYTIFELNKDKFDSTYDGFLNLIHPDDLELVDHFYIESLKSRVPFEITHRIIMPDGQIKYIQEKCITQFNENGEPQISFGTMQDISEIYLAQQALLDREKILSSILDTVGNGIFLISVDKNKDFHFMTVNKMMCKIMGFDENDIKGKRFLDVLSGSVNALSVKEKLEEAIKSKRAISWEMKGLRNEESFTGDVNIVPVFDTNGKCVYVVGAIHDITLRKKAEEDLSQLNQLLEQKVLERTEQLELANKELESFAYSVSHDLRAPLRHIDGFAKLLKESLNNQLNQEANKYFNKIEDAGVRMASMIDSLLKFSRLGRQALQITHIQLNKLFVQIIKNAEPDIQQRNIQFKVDEFPVIQGDKPLLELAFNNIINNAIKFTIQKEKALIEIGKFDAGSDYIGIYVKDNGAGFDMTYVDKLFGVFQRLHTQNQYPGTGIGLANVFQIIKKHNGSIWAESKENEGATFFIKLKRNLI